jgi:hypothetical protein
MVKRPYLSGTNILSSHQIILSGLEYIIFVLLEQERQKSMVPEEELYLPYQRTVLCEEPPLSIIEFLLQNSIMSWFLRDTQDKGSSLRGTTLPNSSFKRTNSDLLVPKKEPRVQEKPLHLRNPLVTSEP